MDEAMINQHKLKSEAAMKFRPLIVMTLSAFFLFGCSAQSTGWRPTVDTTGSPRAQYLSQDERECEALARQAGGSTAGETARGAGTGALGGAATGAVIGAIAGNAGMGAAIGATAGALGGGAFRGVNSNQRFRSAFTNCMRQRGHRVIN
jgi:uncharacterized protein YcfJ